MPQGGKMPSDKQANDEIGISVDEEADFEDFSNSSGEELSHEENAKNRPKDNSAESIGKPKLANRREHKKSTFVTGRTIGEKRERLETKRERVAAREKDKRKNRNRVIVVSLAFAAIIVILFVLARIFFAPPAEEPIANLEPEPIALEEPTIEIVDASANGNDGKITSRMKTYIANLESDLRNLGYQPTKAVIPVGAIREVDFYIDGHNGYFKTTIDRGAGVTAEDIDRMLRYLAGEGISDFEYVDVRIDGRAFWK